MWTINGKQFGNNFEEGWESTQDISFFPPYFPQSKRYQIPDTYVERRRREKLIPLTLIYSILMGNMAGKVLVEHCEI